MKISILTLTVFLNLIITHGQTSEPLERFTVFGKAKLIATWPDDTANLVSGRLNSGAKLVIVTNQIGLSVTAIHNNIGKQLVTIGEEEESLENMIVKAYEYDFDDDGLKEIIIIYSPQFSERKIEVFKYSSGLAERVGKFDAQFQIYIEENIISAAIGFQGIANEYIYKWGNFYELVYHNPEDEDD